MSESCSTPNPAVERIREIRSLITDVYLFVCKDAKASACKPHEMTIEAMLDAIRSSSTSTWQEEQLVSKIVSLEHQLNDRKARLDVAENEASTARADAVRWKADVVTWKSFHEAAVTHNKALNQQTKIDRKMIEELTDKLQSSTEALKRANQTTADANNIIDQYKRLTDTLNIRIVCWANAAASLVWPFNQVVKSRFLTASLQAEGLLSNDSKDKAAK